MFIIFLFTLIIIIIWVYFYSVDNFYPKVNIDNNNYTEIKDLVYSDSKVSCCLIKKSFQPNPNNMYGGNFVYLFEKKFNENCDTNRYNEDSSTQLLIDNLNNWSNDMCNSEAKKIGSCRNINKECIDFVSKDFCDKYKMTWSDKTCNQPLDFKWIDPIKLKIPDKNPDLGVFKMF